MSVILRVLLVLLCLAVAGGGAAEPRPSVPAVTVVRDGNRLAIDVRMTVAVPLATAWQVLTDFDHMAGFLPNLTSSEAVADGPNRLRVRQTGTARWGVFSFDFESVRVITLVPMTRIAATTLSGKISRMSSLCQLTHADDGAHIQYHADAEIDFWLPPVVGVSALRHEMEEQFAAMAGEMLRRHGGG